MVRVKRNLQLGMVMAAKHGANAHVAKAHLR